ncbi:MAG: hypothetical protein IJX00_03210 [Clostridia bacterium]|nr:hypothetical protein [Clostridia bacterium]
MNFDNLSVEGCAAFVLAIVFSVITFASIIYFATHKTSKTLVAVLATMVFPVITVFCWTYLIMNVCEQAVALSLYVSLGAAVGYLLIALAIAAIIVAARKAKQNRPEKVVETEIVEETPAEEPVQEAGETLLITSSEEVVEEVAEEQPAEVVEEVEEVVEVAEEQPAEEIEEVVEETAEEVAEETTEEPEIIEEIEDEDDDEDEDDEESPKGVVFANTPKETFASQLAKLDEEYIAYFSEILTYAQEKPKTKTKEAKTHLTVSIGRMKVVQFKFIRKVLVGTYLAGSSELKNYTAKEKSVKIKEKPVVISIDNEGSIEVSKNMIDIVYKNIMDAKAEKKAQAKAEKLANAETDNNDEE